MKSLQFSVADSNRSMGLSSVVRFGQRLAIVATGVCIAMSKIVLSALKMTWVEHALWTVLQLLFFVATLCLACFKTVVTTMKLDWLGQILNSCLRMWIVAAHLFVGVFRIALSLLKLPWVTQGVKEGVKHQNA